MSRRTVPLLTCSILLALSVISSTYAEVILASQGYYLARIDVQTGAFDVVAPGRNMNALAIDDRGRLWGASRIIMVPIRRFRMYRINDPLAIPWNTLICTCFESPVPATEWINGELYGVQNRPEGQRLVRIDPLTGQTTLVGATGNMGIVGVEGLAFDAQSATLYALALNGLYTLDWSLTLGPEPLASEVGFLGFGDNRSSGLDWHEPSGTLYAAIRRTGDNFGVYTIDTSTGRASLFRDLSCSMPAFGFATGIAVLEGSLTVACPGDLNADGVVDLSDLGVLLADFGCHGSCCAGDLDGDGDTDLVDLGIVLANFGATCP
jgi:hypothetical protein